MSKKVTAKELKRIEKALKVFDGDYLVEMLRFVRDLAIEEKDTQAMSLFLQYTCPTANHRLTVSSKLDELEDDGSNWDFLTDDEVMMVDDIVKKAKFRKETGS